MVEKANVENITLEVTFEKTNESLSDDSPAIVVPKQESKMNLSPAKKKRAMMKRSNACVINAVDNQILNIEA